MVRIRVRVIVIVIDRVRVRVRVRLGLERFWGWELTDKRTSTRGRLGVGLVFCISINFIRQPAHSVYMCVLDLGHHRDFEAH